VAIGSITTTTGIVSWQPSGNPVYYIVEHRLANTGGNWASANVYNSAYTLTNLSPCKTYEVRLRTFCGGQNYSGYTTPVQFNTASTNPTVSWTVNEVGNGCALILGATPGYASYCWTFNSLSDCSGDTNAIAINTSGTLQLTVTDAQGCVGNSSYTVPSFPSLCVTHSRDVAIKNALVADSATIRSDLSLIAKSLAGLLNDSVIKVVVKNTAIAHGNNGEYYARINVLSDSCQNRNINLKSVMKQSLWSNGGTTQDTARLAAVMNGFSVNTSPSTTVYPVIFYQYLDTYYHDPNLTPAWDNLSPRYVVPLTFHSTPYKSFYLNSSNVVQFSYINPNQLKNKPIWSIFVYNNELNVFETWDGTISNAIGIPGCSCGPPKTSTNGYCDVSTSHGCDRSCNKDCTGWQRFKTDYIY
jgi:hypothetical protein